MPLIDGAYGAPVEQRRGSIELVVNGENVK